MARYCWTRESTFDFIREKVMECCNELPTIKEQLSYLNFVLLEKKNRPAELDENIGLKPTFEKFIQNEIEYRKFLLKLEEEETIGLIRIRGRVSDVVRIFEAMKKADIISLKTEATQIGRIFFSEKVDIKDFATKYNARKKEIRDEERSTSSEPLLKFIYSVIETNFKGKPEILDLILEHVKRQN